MRLTKIKLVGFKSFVDPTTVNFNHQRTAIVGPNGCGKSNIIDAVRWVLGESSAKNLRGDAMTDVIFNGSNTRKPLGMASIELVFDNSEGRVQGEFANYNEISVKRQVTRDAVSSYFLNGTRCRRRDIKDIFMGTGLGPRSYAIIEQGMISRLVDAKPDELRVTIEEVAGISKYKERRRETENRMRHTRENLDRLNDLKEEVDKRLRRLTQQKHAAERYQVLKADERHLTGVLFALRQKNIIRQLEAKKQALRDIENQRQAALAQETEHTRLVETNKAAWYKAHDRLQEIQEENYSINHQVASVEQSIEHLQTRQNQFSEDNVKMTSRRQALQQELSDEKQQLERLQSEITELSPRAQSATAADQQAQQTLRNQEQALHALQQRWDEWQDTSSQTASRAQVTQTQIKHFEESIMHARLQIEKLEKELLDATTDTLQAKIASLDQEIAQLSERESQQSNQLQTLSDAITLQKQHNQDTEQTQQKLTSELQAALTEKAHLEAVVKVALGKDDSVSVEWLSQKGLDQMPRLAELITVEPKWMQAAEMVLGDQLSALCIDSWEQCQAHCQDFTGKQLQFIRSDNPLIESSRCQLPRLNSFVTKGQDWASALLSHVFCALDLEQAWENVPHLHAHESIITPEGVWISRHVVKIQGDAGQETAGILATEQQLQEVVAKVEQLQTEQSHAQQHLSQGKQQLDEILKQQEELNHQLKQSFTERAEKTSRLGVFNERLQQIQAKIERLRADINQHQQHMETASEQINPLRSTLAQDLDQMEQDAQIRGQLQQEKAQCQTDLNAIRLEAKEIKEAAHQLNVELSSAQTRHQAVTTSIERFGLQLTTLDEQLQTLQDNISQLTPQIEQNNQSLALLLEQKCSIEQRMRDAKEKVDDLQMTLDDHETKRSEAAQQATRLQDSLVQHKVDIEGLNVRHANIEESLQAEGITDINSVLNKVEESVDEKQLQQELDQTTTRIQRLGAINLAAIEEFDAEQERSQYIEKQLTDLNDALATLQSAIDKIDLETKEKFKQTFDTVNTNLKSLFPKVFGGGQAYLTLTSEELLEAGVTLMAQPPGKKNSTIHLLSGGEKALTAMALVFSMFQLNPAPFCMLDEVDAPLDDMNVTRYCKLVEELSNQVQFIFISHNKITMEMADALMGVTMQEGGVSRLVSVDMHEAREMVA